MSLRLQLSRFFGVGVAATFADYGTMILLREWLALNPVWASLLGYCAGGLVSYALNRRHTFATRRSHAQAGWRFASVMAVGFSLTGLFMQLFANVFGAPYVLARLVTTGIVFFWNFIAHKLWTFNARG